MLICPEVVNPQRLRPRSRAGRLTVEEQDVRLHSLGVEDAGGQAQQCVNVGLFQQFAPNRLPGAALKEYVIWHHDGSSPVNLRHDFTCCKKLSRLLLVVAQKSSRT